MAHIVEILIGAILVSSVVTAYLLHRIASCLREMLDLQAKWAKDSPAESHLLNGQYDEAIEINLAKIEDTPSHFKAHWYLGRAYYGKEMWQEARREMEIVGRLNPPWIEDTQPYIMEIEKKLQQSPDGESEERRNAASK
jgi:tetratricopeptide (TPR) repeat protein